MVLMIFIWYKYSAKYKFAQVNLSSVQQWHSKNIRDENAENLSDSEENANTFKRPNDQAMKNSIKTLKAFIQREPSSE